MTTTERLKRIGSLELKKRLGPNMVRGLIASVFIHSAVVSIGLIDWVKEQKVIVWHVPPIHQEVPPITQPDPDQIPPVIQLDYPVLPDEMIPIPKDEEPEIAEEIEEEELDKDKLLEGKAGPQADTLIIEGDGYGGSLDGLGEVDLDIAGYVEPWKDFVPREIEPVPLSINPQPEYPSIAAKAGIAGKVYVWVLVGADGKVNDWNIIHVTTPNMGFEEAVEKIIEKWQFTPAIQGNTPVAVWVNIPFNFRVNQ